MAVFVRTLFFVSFFALLSVGGAAHSKVHRTEKVASVRAEPVAVKDKDGAAEARLIEIYNLIGNGRTREALANATQLAHDLPNFQLAQLVYGDLLNARTRSVQVMGDVPDEIARTAGTTLAELSGPYPAQFRHSFKRYPREPSMPLPLMPRAHACTCSKTRHRV
jgi:L,D-transpeptidase YnhG